MAMRSREVLEDCKLALAEFQTAGANEAQWRIRWVALVALLRSVGHVLDKIDGKQPAEWRKAVDDAWNTRAKNPEHSILWEFIEAERNNVLKMYEIGVRLNTSITTGTAAKMGFSPSIAPYRKNYATTYESFMRSRSFSGHDALELCTQAIEFWQKYLDEVEAAATKSP